MFGDAAIALLRSLDLPLGGMLIGVALGAMLYALLDRLSRRPRMAGAARRGIEVVAPPAPGSAPEPEDPAVRTVTVTDAAGERTVQLRGAGLNPNAPLPRARGFIALLVGIFAGLTVVQLAFFSVIYRPYDQLVAYAGTAIFWPLPWPGVYAVSATQSLVPDFVFPMYLAAMGGLAVAGGLVYRRPPLPLGRRLAGLGLLLLYVGVEVVLDAIFFTVPGQSVRDLAIVVRTFAGGIFLSLLIFCIVVLPAPRRMQTKAPRDRGTLAQFAATALGALVIAGVVLVLLDRALGLEAVVLPFTLLLLLPLVTLEAFIALNRPLYYRQVRGRRLPSVAQYHPPVSIVMPAFNEEQWIARAIGFADAAAGHYPGSVEIIVGNDGSTDGTSALARTAIQGLQHARGMVVDLPHAGKSNALNGALALATGEIVIRLDADTFVSEEPGFAPIIPHFADPQVGGVQGAIHPRQRQGWTRKLRALEIAWGHYFQRPALMGVRSGEVIDGLFSAFRRKTLVALGGWVPWNGEDTEISMRLQRLGYRVRIELGAVAFEDVPADYDALRRQRVRWARGILMANGQHYPAIVGPTPEYGGLGTLFWFLTFARSGVRSLVYLFLALLLLLGVHALVDVAYLIVIAIAVRGIPLAYFLGRMRRWDAIPWIPFFPIASALKQSFRFEALGLLGPESRHEYT